ncbi:FecCD family ABC transporter permease, partial [Thiolapillus sp.]|uniref:FecCD family ABC transporter permease n=2 Tax=Thiolapillus sp. TaxID=2017437 RepID=UPI003AF4FCF6
MPLLLLLVLLAAVCLTLSLMIGSVSIPASDLWSLLWHDDGSVQYRIIHELRLPRTLSAFGVGGVLALAGVLMQALLRNPLADPYILGVSGGAAVAVLGAMLLGLPLAWQAPMALGGALASTLLLFALAHHGNWNTSRLLLTGVVLAAGWAALISFVLSLSPPMQLPGMLFWLMGDLSDALHPGLPLVILFIGLVI